LPATKGGGFLGGGVHPMKRWNEETPTIQRKTIAKNRTSFFSWLMMRQTRSRSVKCAHEMSRGRSTGRRANAISFAIVKGVSWGILSRWE
jgi:hypothetical protein